VAIGVGGVAVPASAATAKPKVWTTKQCQSYKTSFLKRHHQKPTKKQIASADKVLKKHGVCSEPTWPYQEDRFREEPSREAFEEAKQHTIDEYHWPPAEGWDGSQEVVIAPRRAIAGRPAE